MNETKMRVLFVRFSAYGDICMCLPAIVHFRRVYSEAETHFLVAHKYADLLTNHKRYEIDYLHIYNRIGGFKGWLEMLNTANKLRPLKFDAIFNWQSNPRSKILLSAVGSKTILSFNRFMRIHQIEKIYLTLKQFGLKQPDKFEPIPLAGDSEIKWASGVLSHVPRGRIKIVIGIGGLWQTKLWQVSNFIETMRILSNSTDAHFVLIGDSRDLDRSDAISSAFQDRIINLTGRTTILQSAAIISLSDLTISNDTSTMHLSWVQGTPTIGIFGSTDPKRTGPLGEKAFVFASTLLPCHPCFQGYCKISEIENLKCLNSIKPEEVAERAVQLIFKNSG